MELEPIQFPEEDRYDSEYHEQMTRASQLAINIAEFLQLQQSACEEIRLTNFVFDELQELLK